MILNTAESVPADAACKRTLRREILPDKGCPITSKTLSIQIPEFATISLLSGTCDHQTRHHTEEKGNEARKGIKLEHMGGIFAFLSA